ncbi:MAG: efflux RND transporter periplasmic adaptor subunit [Candidatus Omnitrophota bacterium]
MWDMKNFKNIDMKSLNPKNLNLKKINLKDIKAGDVKKFLVENKKTVIKAAVVILCLFMVFKGCSRKPKQVIPPKPVETALAQTMDVPEYIDAFGTLSSVADVDIRAQVTGQIKEVGFEEGAEVKKGDVLFVMDTSKYEAAVEKAKGALDKDLADLELKKDTLRRNETLVAKKLISQQDFEQYKTDVAAQQAMVELDRGALKIAETDLDYCYIRSPIDGLTGRRQVDPGNIVMENDGPTLVNIRDISKLYLDFAVSDAYFTDVTESMRSGKLKVEIRMGDDKVEPYNGEVQMIENTVDTTTGTVMVRAVASNDDRKMWPGQFVKVRLILGTYKDAVVVPYAAATIGQNGYYLFVVTDKDKADLRQLNVGEKYDDYIIINDGVKAGERVVTVGQMGLSPGVAVQDISQKDTDTGKDKGKKKGAKKKK